MRATGQQRAILVIVATLGCISGVSDTARAQNQLWLQQFGSADEDWAAALAADGAGGVMIAGTTRGSLVGTSAGDGDAFLGRFDAEGNQVWLRQLGTIGVDIARALAQDAVGGVFVAGGTTGDLGGPSLGDIDIWIARYDAFGNQLWIAQFGTAAVDLAYALSPDDSGGVFVAGYTAGSLGGPAAGGGDVFLARLDSDGNRSWITQIGAQYYGDAARALAPDRTDGVYVAGYTRGSLAAPNPGGDDAWLARYDGAGSQIWIRQIGSMDLDQATGLAADGAGGVFVAGWTKGNLGAPNAGRADAWLAHYDETGDQTWLRQFGTSEAEGASALAPDESGGVYVTGDTYGTLGALRFGRLDAWLVKYDGSGNQVWSKQFGSEHTDRAYALASDATGGVFAAGEWAYRSLPSGVVVGNAWVTRFSDSCYPDCDQSTGVGALDIFDFLCFQSGFVNSDPYACDCDTSTGLGVCEMLDFLCFQSAFLAACP